MTQGEKKLSWRQLGAVVSVAHDALYRQFASGGPVVTASPFYSRESRNNMMTTTAQLAIAFRTVDDGRLHVLAEADVQGLDSFTKPFNPSNPSPYFVPVSWRSGSVMDIPRARGACRLVR